MLWRNKDVCNAPVGMLATYAISSFADFVDAELTLASTHVFLSLELMVDALTFCHWPLAPRLHSQPQQPQHCFH